MIKKNRVNIKINRNFLIKTIVINLLKKIKYGSIELIDGNERYLFGKQEYDEQTITVNILHPLAYKKILLAGSVGAGKSYIDGDWSTTELQGLIALFIKNEALFKHLESPFARFLSCFRTIRYKLNLNTLPRAKENILAHYDLGNEFFQLILDPAMMYSCALYEPAGISLEQAARKKIHRICQQLKLKKSDHVLEIGTGWGGFALYAAQEFGCKVTTTTISNKQHAYVKAKIKQRGLENQIELLNLDYRKLSGQYDKVVSIEMVEAVGHNYLDVFFNKCNQLTKSQGLFFIQAIVINDQAYKGAKNEVDFIKKYIFPGSCLPSIYSISKSIATQTKLQLIALNDIGKHYVTTLNEWQKRMFEHKKMILEQGFTEQFLRTWEFYFCYSAAGFESSHISDIHALWQKK